MAARKLIDLERERDSFITYENRIIQERDEILHNLRTHLNDLDTEIVRRGGRPRSDIRQGIRRGSSSNNLNSIDGGNDGGTKNDSRISVSVGPFPSVRKQRRRKSVDGNNDAQSPLKALDKKPRGRPRKNAIDVVPGHVLISVQGTANHKAKKKRGRPRKIRDVDANDEIAPDNAVSNSNIENSTAPASLKKVDQNVTYSPHYSPRKNILNNGASKLVLGSDVKPKKKRGRPPKNKGLTATAVAGVSSSNAFNSASNTPKISNVASNDSDELNLHGSNKENDSFLDDAARKKQKIDDFTGVAIAGNWTCDCGDVISLTKARCGKCRRWKGGKREVRWKVDKEKRGRSDSISSIGSVATNESVGEVYKAFSNAPLTSSNPSVDHTDVPAGENVNANDSVKSVMGYMVSAVSFTATKSKIKDEKPTSSGDAPKRKRGRPRKDSTKTSKNINSAASIGSASTQQKRKVGRPRKDSTENSQKHATEGEKICPANPTHKFATLSNSMAPETKQSPAKSDCAISENVSRVSGVTVSDTQCDLEQDQPADNTHVVSSQKVTTATTSHATTLDRPRKDPPEQTQKHVSLVNESLFSPIQKVASAPVSKSIFPTNGGKPNHKHLPGKDSIGLTEKHGLQGIELLAASAGSAMPTSPPIVSGYVQKLKLSHPKKASAEPIQMQGHHGNETAQTPVQKNAIEKSSANNTETTTLPIKEIPAQKPTNQGNESYATPTDIQGEASPKSYVLESVGPMRNLYSL